MGWIRTLSTVANCIFPRLIMEKIKNDILLSQKGTFGSLLITEMFIEQSFVFHMHFVQSPYFE